jgi:hypothetical protein
MEKKVNRTVKYINQILSIGLADHLVSIFALNKSDRTLHGCAVIVVFKVFLGVNGFEEVVNGQSILLAAYVDL